VNRPGITLLGMFLELPTSPEKYVPIKMKIFSAFFLLRPYYITPKGIRRLLPVCTVTAIVTVMYITVAGLV
jgi:hypothetical protein